MDEEKVVLIAIKHDIKTIRDFLESQKEHTNYDPEWSDQLCFDELTWWIYNNTPLMKKGG